MGMLVDGVWGADFEGKQAPDGVSFALNLHIGILLLLQVEVTFLPKLEDMN